MAKPLTWEQAVAAYRDLPGNEAAVLANYFDLPVSRAAMRYAAGEEFAEVARLLADAPGRRVLDFGAGNGIASYALASRGWQVTALEPDPSAVVGAEAIRGLARDTRVDVSVVETVASQLPFSDRAFDAIHARQVLHHVPSLESSIAELFRVLDHGGLLLATREHVVSNDRQLRRFLRQHPLHESYGGENAYPVERYRGALVAARFRIRAIWGPRSSPINFYPGSEAQRRRLHRRVAFGLGRALDLAPRLQPHLLRWLDQRDQHAGRLYTFFAEKP